LIRIRLIFYKINLKLMTEKFCHRLLYKFIIYSLFSLILIACLSRKRAYNKHKTVRHIAEIDFRLILIIFIKNESKINFSDVADCLVLVKRQSATSLKLIFDSFLLYLLLLFKYLSTA